jgi:hypothetical protein
MTDLISRAVVLDLCREWYPLLGGDVCDWAKFQAAITDLTAFEPDYAAACSRHAEGPRPDESREAFVRAIVDAAWGRGA